MTTAPTTEPPTIADLSTDALLDELERLGAYTLVYVPDDPDGQPYNATLMVLRNGKPVKGMQWYDITRRACLEGLLGAARRELNGWNGGSPWTS